jgi:hypothetical protein
MWARLIKMRSKPGKEQFGRTFEQLRTIEQPLMEG